METKFDNSFNYYDFASLKQLKSETNENKEEQLKVIASQLESVFLQLVMKNMQDANEAFKSDLYGRGQEDFYQDMLNQQMALSLSKAGGIGLADMILKQLQGTMQNDLPTKKTVELAPFVTAKKSNISQEQIVAKSASTEPEAERVATQAPEIKSTTTTDIQQFVKTVLPFAKQVAKIIGIDPKLLVAQSALETGWGKHVIQNENKLSANNLFGIKAYGEQNKVAAETTEYVNKQPVRQIAEFKSYATMLESFLDYVSLLQTKRYEKALANTNDPKAFLTELQNAGYATDPDYANKVLAIYENHPSLNEV